MSCNQNEINTLISSYYQNDTLNIFGHNWQKTVSKSAICPELLTTPPTQTTGCGCSTTQVVIPTNNSVFGPSVVDYVCKLILLFQSPIPIPNSNPPRAPNSSTGQLIQYSFNYTTNVSPVVNPSQTPTESDVLFITLQTYQAAYNNYIHNPSAGLVSFVAAKKALFELVCGYVQEGSVVIAELFGTDITDPNAVLCVFREILEILCEKDCCERGGKCNDKKKCQCTPSCENAVIALLGDGNNEDGNGLSGLFASTTFPDMTPISSPVQNPPATPIVFSDNDGGSPVTNYYAANLTQAVIQVGSIVINLPNINNITTSTTGVPVPSGTINFNIGDLMYNFYNAYLNTLLCPCNTVIQSKLSAAISAVQTLIAAFSPSGVNYTIFQGIMTSLTNPQNDPRAPDFSFVTLESILAQISVVLSNCPNCVSCGECETSCEVKVITELATLSADIIAQISQATGNYITNWGVASPTSSAPAFMPPWTLNGILSASFLSFIQNSSNSISSVNVPPKVTFSNSQTTFSSSTEPALAVTMKFIKVGQYLDCNGILSTIYLPDITVVEYNSMTNCMMSTTIKLGDLALTYYNAWIALVTGPCDSTYAARKFALQAAGVALEPIVCVTNVCGVADIFTPDVLGQVVSNDLATLCCLLEKCNKITCCKMGHVAEFIIELINLNCVAPCCRDDKTIIPCHPEKMKPCGHCGQCGDCSDDCHDKQNLNRGQTITRVDQQQPQQVEQHPHNPCDEIFERKKDCNFELYELNSALIQLFLNKKPSKCVDPRLMSVYMFETFIQLFSSKLCCLENRVARDEHNLCETKKDICELYENDKDLQKCQEELKCKVCELARCEFATKSSLNSVITQVSCIGNEVAKLSNEIDRCCHNKCEDRDKHHCEEPDRDKHHHCEEPDCNICKPHRHHKCDEPDCNICKPHHQPHPHPHPQPRPPRPCSPPCPPHHQPHNQPYPRPRSPPPRRQTHERESISRLDEYQQVQEYPRPQARGIRPTSIPNSQNIIRIPPSNSQRVSNVSNAPTALDHDEFTNEDKLLRRIAELEGSIKSNEIKPKVSEKPRVATNGSAWRSGSGNGRF